MGKKRDTDFFFSLGQGVTKRCLATHGGDEVYHLYPPVGWRGMNDHSVLSSDDLRTSMPTPEGETRGVL